MSIIKDENGNVHVSYSIPEEINSHIPDYFYYAMAGELVSIFGPEILNKEKEYYDLDSGTGGWEEAFKATCYKLDMDWLLDYYKTLEWFDSDIFDDIIESNIIDNFCKKNHQEDYANCYYKYLIGRSEKNNELLDKKN